MKIKAFDGVIRITLKIFRQLVNEINLYYYYYY